MLWYRAFSLVITWPDRVPLRCWFCDEKFHLPNEPTILLNFTLTFAEGDLWTLIRDTCNKKSILDKVRERPDLVMTLNCNIFKIWSSDLVSPCVRCRGWKDSSSTNPQWSWEYNINEWTLLQTAPLQKGRNWWMSKRLFCSYVWDIMYSISYHATKTYEEIQKSRSWLITSYYDSLSGTVPFGLPVCLFQREIQRPPLLWHIVEAQYKYVKLQVKIKYCNVELFCAPWILSFFSLSASFHSSFSHSSVITSSGKPSLIALPMTNFQLHIPTAPYIYYL